MGKEIDIGDHRFDGLSEAEAVELVRMVSDGPGSRAVADAPMALYSSARILRDLDLTLHRGLDELGISWQSGAGDLAQGLFASAARYADAASLPLQNTAMSVEDYGRSHAETVYAMPTEAEIRVTSSESASDRFLGLFGYESDFDREERAAREAREVVADRMNLYRDLAAWSLAGHVPLDPPPPITLIADPPAPVVDRTAVGTTALGGSPAHTGAAGNGPAAVQPSAPPPVAPTAPAPTTPSAPGPLAPPIGSPTPNPVPAVPGAEPGLVTGPPARGGSRVGLRLPGESGLRPGGGEPGFRPGSGERGNRPGGDHGHRPGGGSATPGRPDGTSQAPTRTPAPGPEGARATLSARQSGMPPFLPPGAAGGRTDDEREHERRFVRPSAEPFEDDAMVAPPVIGGQDER